MGVPCMGGGQSDEGLESPHSDRLGPGSLGVLVVHIFRPQLDILLCDEVSTLFSEHGADALGELDVLAHKLHAHHSSVFGTVQHVVVLVVDVTVRQVSTTRVLNKCIAHC